MTTDENLKQKEVIDEARKQSTKNTKVELYSEAILRKTIPDPTQHSPNKDHQHLK